MEKPVFNYTGNNRKITGGAFEKRSVKKIYSGRDPVDPGDRHIEPLFLSVVRRELFNRSFVTGKRDSMGTSETAVFSRSAVYAGREGLAGGKIPWKILRKSPGTVGRPGCNASTVLWLYLVYRKGLSLGRYRDFCHKRADGFSGALFLQEPPCGILQSEKKPAGTFCPADSVLSGVSCFYEMNRSCSRAASCNRRESVLS